MGLFIFSSPILCDLHWDALLFHHPKCRFKNIQFTREQESTTHQNVTENSTSKKGTFEVIFPSSSPPAPSSSERSLTSPNLEGTFLRKLWFGSACSDRTEHHCQSKSKQQSALGAWTCLEKHLTRARPCASPPRWDRRWWGTRALHKNLQSISGLQLSGLKQPGWWGCCG